MPDKKSDKHTHDLVHRSKIYQEYCLKKEQILKYKWIESEKVGQDIGLDKAWIQWEAKYYRKWKNSLTHPKPNTGSEDHGENHSGKPAK